MIKLLGDKRDPSVTLFTNLRSFNLKLKTNIIIKTKLDLIKILYSKIVDRHFYILGREPMCQSYLSSVHNRPLIVVIVNKIIDSLRLQYFVYSKQTLC